VLVLSKDRITQLTQRDALLLFQRAREDPLFFCEHILGIHLWSKQRKIFRAVFSHDRVAVKACHASGKSYVAAAIVLAYVHTVSPSVVVTTAPVGRQVVHVIWREVNRMVRNSRFPLGGEPLTSMYRLTEDTYAIGIATDDPEKIQGLHGENVLVIVDEAAGMPDHIMDAVESMLSGGNTKLLLLGNPSRTEGYFYRAFNDKNESKIYRQFTISAFDTPNVRHRRNLIPGLVTWEWVRQRREVWGESHPLYQIRVLGEFPAPSYTNLVIPPYLLDIARSNELESRKTDPLVFGVDVGEYGDAETAVAVRKGSRLLTVQGWQGLSLEEQFNRLVNLIKNHAHRHPGRVEIRVDRIGVGHGLYELLRKFAAESRGQYFVVGVDVRERPIHPEVYADTRSEAWMEFRARLVDREVDMVEYDRSGADVDILYSQLTLPRYVTNEKSQVKVESKKELRRRGIYNLDRADAVILAFYDAYMERARVLTPPNLSQYEHRPTLIETEAPWRETRF